MELVYATFTRKIICILALIVGIVLLTAMIVSSSCLATNRSKHNVKVQAKSSYTIEWAVGTHRYEEDTNTFKEFDYCISFNKKKVCVPYVIEENK